MFALHWINRLEENLKENSITLKNGRLAMTQKQIRVGIVGANSQRSWANMSHVPAINGLSGLRLAAVATRNEQSARKAAEAFGADRWFSDPLAMIGDDQIDVITISVNVPAHRELVLAALDAGKAVYTVRRLSGAPSGKLKRWPARSVHSIPRSDYKAV
jgi:Oxidoreductase family, NAD-binding Rossmann fold